MLDKILRTILDFFSVFFVWFFGHIPEIFSMLVTIAMLVYYGMGAINSFIDFHAKRKAK